MFSWVTGSRTPVVEDVPEPTLLEPPETPAPLFAFRALKHAVWGTPSAADNQLSSPNKKTGILMTPGTSTSRRKQVTFGAQVADNEGNKKPTRTNSSSRSGLPSNCPGKFPSPWTPKSVGRAEVKRKTRLTTALQQAKKSKKEKKVAEEDDDDEEETEEEDGDGEGESTTRKEEPAEQSTAKPQDESKKKVTRKSKVTGTSQAPKTSRSAESSSPALVQLSDGSEVTVSQSSPDVSGDPDTVAYWKARYEAYAEKSERETRRLIKKTKLAKQYAKTKDSEMIALAAKLDEERKRHKTREHEIAAQTKDYKERLRQALGENARCTTEIATLKKRLGEVEASGEKRSTRSSSRKSVSPEKKRNLPETPPVDIWEDQIAESGDGAGSAVDARETSTSDGETKENEESGEHESTVSSSRKSSRSRSSTRSRSAARSRSSERSKRHGSTTPKEAFPPNRLTLARAKINEKRAQRLRQKENGKPIR